jgi:Na+/proline symporter
MKWVWERRRTLIFWGFIVYLLVLAAVLATGTIADVVDPPQPTVVP